MGCGGIPFPLQHLSCFSCACSELMGKDGALRLCGRMRSRLLWSVQPPECPYPASVSLQNLLMMQGRPAARGAVLSSASREKTGEAESRAQNIPALIAGAGQSPALGLGSARQLNQQIISRARAGGLAALPFPAIQPGVNPFIHISKTPKLWGLLEGEMLPQDQHGWGCPGCCPSPDPGPRRGSIPGSRCAAGRAVSPVPGGSFVHLRAAR